MCRALSNCRQRGQVRLVESLNNTACFLLNRVPVLYFIIIHLVLKGTSDDVRLALLVAPLAVPSFMRVW